MGKVTGFIEIEREDRKYAPVSERTRHFREFVLPPLDKDIQRQAARCMDCGIPYCHRGCPVNNQIPDWNDLVYHDDWDEASRNLHSTNNFPEITGRICPAPCEASCTLNLDDVPVTIKSIECAIADRAFDLGNIKPELSSTKTGKRIAIVGSGPAGLAAGQQLARAGHDVHIYEKNAEFGGLLRYGIPDFKLEKHIVERRIHQLRAEGVTFHPNTHIGIDITVDTLESDYDAVLLAGGAEKPRDLAIPGRELDGIEFAMNFLPQQNRRVSGELLWNAKPILATGKNVVVIGGGDTGSDCIGTSFRQDARSVTQIEILAKPPEKEDKQLSWPHWPLKLRTSSSQAEGATRDFGIMTTHFEGSDQNRVSALHCVRIDQNMNPILGSAFKIDADLILLAMGFVAPTLDTLSQANPFELDQRGNIKASDRDYRASRHKVFAAGDMRRGQSLVVWAIREGRQAAHAIDKFLMGRTDLPR